MRPWRLNFVLIAVNPYLCPHATQAQPTRTFDAKARVDSSPPDEEVDEYVPVIDKLEYSIEGAGGSSLRLEELIKEEPSEEKFSRPTPKDTTVEEQLKESIAQCQSSRESREIR